MPDIISFDEALQKANKKLEKDNKFWNKYTKDLLQAKNIRISAILSQVAIQWYVDRLLFYKFKSDILKDMRYERKIEFLKELKIIDSKLFQELIIIYDIRNIYAHEVDVKEKRIEDLLNKIKKIDNSPVPRKYGNLEDIFLKFSQRFIRILQRIYLDQYVQEFEQTYVLK